MYILCASVSLYILLFVILLVAGRRNSMAAVKQLKELFADAEVGKMGNINGLIDSTKRFDYTRQWMTTGDIKGRSPLLIASMNGCSTVVELLFKEIIEPTNYEELTPNTSIPLNLRIHPDVKLHTLHS